MRLGIQSLAVYGGEADGLLGEDEMVRCRERFCEMIFLGGGEKGRESKVLV